MDTCPRVKNSGVHHLQVIALQGQYVTERWEEETMTQNGGTISGKEEMRHDMRCGQRTSDNDNDPVIRSRVPRLSFDRQLTVAPNYD
ncbi:hypothetical protein CGLO_13621 [Colletotrichum gloeosporioides Cg-14]|uniref:Uncharacterized protein n=1 Tax=Colletotrichum gloeosporioides (strain Cg-14) TaxID=1237896 RepID=T0K5R8_COLGC|nr:hypothetical protein CGLO_13621 [Colletotrichum gloeosporioides Cg-14]